MKYRATHRPEDLDGKPKGEESVVIIKISWPDPELTPSAIFVREDGTLGTDYISRFIIHTDAW